MQKTLAAFAALVAAILLPQAAHSAASEWHEMEGGSLRVVTSGAPDKAGVLRGALEIRLEPGWKTYWRDPGDSGVPPTLTGPAEDVRIDIEFPQPRRFDDGYSLWAGYDRPVALALTFQMPNSGPISAPIEMSAFLGICETICIPVQASFALDARRGANDPEHAVIVAAAFAALPGPSRSGFEARATTVDSDVIAVETVLPDGVDAVDLFVAGTDSITLGTPEKQEGAAASDFSVPIVHRTDGQAGQALSYTLVTTAGAVTGTLQLP